VEKQTAARFAALFAGNVRLHGTYQNINRQRDDGKREGTARTLFEPVTCALYERHLAGSYGLGIAPITDENTCVFGAIDIDVYADLDHTILAAGLEGTKLPLVVCRSKSGGAHLYLFSRKPVAAADMQSKLRSIAAQIGHGTAEVFPKQKVIDASNPEAGANWINLPYFNASSADGKRYAVRADGHALTLDEFLDHAEGCRVAADYFAGSLPDTPDFKDGPPCLQALAASGGWPTGSRNNGLYSIGVFLRKAHPDNCSALLEQYNQKYMNPPLPSEDIVGLKKSLAKVAYRYKCSEEPLVSHCDAGLCRLRKYGIGGGGMPSPEFGLLKKLDTEPPSYTWEIEGKPVPLSVDEMLSRQAFARAVFMRLNLVLPPMKTDKWQEMLREALKTMETIPMPEDASPDGQLWELVKEFCNNRAFATELAEVSLGKAFKDEGFFYLRIADIVSYLNTKRFKAPPVQEIAASLRRRGGKHQAKKLRGQTVNLWILPAANIETSQEPLSLPKELTDPKSTF